nr:hypothetical protein [Tanacetum cinerariifolium]
SCDLRLRRVEITRGSGMTTEKTLGSKTRDKRLLRLSLLERVKIEGHYKSEFSKLKNQNRSNQNGNGRACARAFMLGGGKARQDPNVVTGMDWLSKYDVVIVCDEKLNANPPPTNNLHILPTTLHARVVQELIELQTISTYVDSRLENINQFLNGFTQQLNEIDVDDLELDEESVDTPLVLPFPDSDGDSDNG